MKPLTPITLRYALRRGLRRRCPQCGTGRLFARWYTVHDRCAQCGLDFQAAEGHTWGFMYMSTAFLTGLIALGMFWYKPAHVFAGQVVVFIFALMLILGTLPTRKGLAIAVDFWLNQRLR